MSNQELKQLAVKYMTNLNIYPGFVEDFLNHNQACIFTRTPVGDIGNWADTNKSIKEKIQNLEKEINGVVYGVIETKYLDGVTYNFLFVSEQDKNPPKKIINNVFETYVYGWNTFNNAQSFGEFGTIAISQAGGGLHELSGREIQQVQLELNKKQRGSI